MSAPNWLGASDWVIVSLGFIGVWENVGYNLVLFLAGLTAIPRELYGAAEIDGVKSSLSKFRFVTWPMLGPTMLFVVIITMTRWIPRVRYRARADAGRPDSASETLLHTIYLEEPQSPLRVFRRDHAGVSRLRSRSHADPDRLIDRNIHYG